MAVIGFIFFVTVLSNFYQAIYDDIIYDDFANGWGKLSYVLVDTRDGRTRSHDCVRLSLVDSNTVYFTNTIIDIIVDLYL